MNITEPTHIKDVNSILKEGLSEHRMNAANLSCGISSDFIYNLFLQRIAASNLRGDVLDFGSGIGTFSNLLTETRRFNRIVATDLMKRPETLAPGTEWLQADLNDPTPFNDESFDLIVTPEVIEHLENPRAMVRELARLLRPSGLLMLSTPNNQSWRSKATYLFSDHFAAFRGDSYPAHITALLHVDLERILNESGLSKPTFYYTNKGDIPFMRGLTWQRASAGWLKGRRFSDNVLAVATKK
jgi:2-polyprenyl-3-methyl-5-hydroxy-6-metoxy-1,4-benzoquinol methylase